MLSTCFRFFSIVLATDEFVVFMVVCPLCSQRDADSVLLLLLWMNTGTLCSGYLNAGIVRSFTFLAFASHCGPRPIGPILIVSF
jgi:hypothetical protein